MIIDLLFSFVRVCVLACSLARCSADVVTVLNALIMYRSLCKWAIEQQRAGCVFQKRGATAAVHIKTERARPARKAKNKKTKPSSFAKPQKPVFSIDLQTQNRKRKKKVHSNKQKKVFAVFCLRSHNCICVNVMESVRAVRHPELCLFKNLPLLLLLLFNSIRKRTGTTYE